MPCLHEVCTAFFLFKAFQPLLVTYLHTVVLETVILWSLSFLFALQSCWIITHVLTAFSITFFAQFVKKKVGHLLLGLSGKVFTFDHFFSYRSDFFNNLTISLSKWTEYRINRSLSSSTKSVRLNFRERVEKTKGNAQKTKIENLQNGQEEYGGKNFAYVHIWGKHLKNILISPNFSLKLLWTVI